MLGSCLFIIASILKQPVLGGINLPGFPFFLSPGRAATTLGHITEWQNRLLATFRQLSSEMSACRKKVGAKIAEGCWALYFALTDNPVTGSFGQLGRWQPSSVEGVCFQPLMKRLFGNFPANWQSLPLNSLSSFSLDLWSGPVHFPLVLVSLLLSCIYFCDAFRKSSVLSHWIFQ